MQAQSLALRIAQPPVVARDLLRAHRESYRQFWSWSDAAVDQAMLVGVISTVFGWPIHIGEESNPRSLRNFPMQAKRASIAIGWPTGAAVPALCLERSRRAPALWRRGEVQLDRLAASARARLDGDLSGAGLQNQRRHFPGAVDADPGAEHPAARAVATLLVRCQPEALAHHASTLASGAAGLS